MGFCGLVYKVLIFKQILKEIGQDLSGFNCGLAHVFCESSSSSLCNIFLKLLFEPLIESLDFSCSTTHKCFSYYQ